MSLNKHIPKYIANCVAKSERMILTQLTSTTIKINIIRVNDPTGLGERNDRRVRLNIFAMEDWLSLISFLNYQKGSPIPGNPFILLEIELISF